MDSATDEEVFYRGHPSWRSILGFYVKGVLLSILAGTIAGIVTRLSGRQVEVGWVIPAVALVFAIMLVSGLLIRIQTTYAITSRRLTIGFGFFSRELHEARLERIQNIDLHQSLVERILQIGTVTFDTAGEAGSDFSFRGVADPRWIVRTVDAAIHDRRIGESVRTVRTNSPDFAARTGGPVRP
ncbi:MAG: PH domain-containing protein [Solirubrobacterales bacterium]|nr:PH domain-containing protein [Solirubrobacterales bacterium]